ncbi:MAG: hypothetical protein JW931_00825 [Methanomicrobiaceae archaeon]|nr:hypothetical protein [Methanomicrobiaceae archaeon]
MGDFGKISLLAGIILAVFLLSAGCTSSFNDQRADTATAAAVQDAGAAAAETQVSEAKNDLEVIEEQLSEIAGVWAVSEVRCSGNSCTADVSNENGNTAVIKVYVYSSTDSAQKKFDDEKNEYVGFTMITPNIPHADDTFAWKEKTESRGGAISANVVAIVDVTIPGGLSIAGRESGIVEAEDLLKQVAVVL